jgi:hypothetical protein
MKIKERENEIEKRKKIEGKLKGTKEKKRNEQEAKGAKDGSKQRMGNT